MAPRAYGESGLFTLSEFRNRGVIKLAPDVLVYISGDLRTSVITPVSGTTLNFNDGITSVNVQNNVDPPGSSNATIDITAPIYGADARYWTMIKENGKTYRAPVFVPMQEVKIFMKGRFLKDMSPKYYPVFWGLISNVDENFSGGVWKMTLNCVDMLHWWSWSTVNLHPVPATNVALGGTQSLTAYSSIFKDASPFTIMHRLAKDMYVPEAADGNQLNRGIEYAAVHRFHSPAWVGQKNPLEQIYPPYALKQVAIGLMNYWQRRFQSLGTLLKMYGIRGQPVTVMDQAGNDIRIQPPVEYWRSTPPDESEKQQASYSLVNERYDVSEHLKDFTTFFEFDKMGEFTDAEYMSKLEIAINVKNRVEYEFFQDVDGVFVFKPPFYNMNTKYVQAYIIKPNDIINNSFQTDAEGIVTVLEVQTPFSAQMRDAQYPSGKGFHVDIDLAKKYGIRHHFLSLQYIKPDVQIARTLAVGHMDLINAKTFTGNVTIPGRPEIRLGYPVYLEHRDSFHYVKSVTHSFDYGGSFNTTLSLEAERQKIRVFSNNQQTARVVTDHIYVFTGETNLNEVLQTNYTKKKDDILQSTERLLSLRQGRYEIVSRKAAIQSLKAGGRTNLRTDYRSITETTVPFTDEEGYKLIGSFEYGRGIILRGSVIIDDEELASTITEEEDIKRARNDLVKDIEPTSGAAQESAAMSGFFNERGEDRDSAIAQYIDTLDMRITSPKIAETDPVDGQNVVGITNMSVLSTTTDEISASTLQALDQAQRSIETLPAAQDLQINYNRAYDRMITNYSTQIANAAQETGLPPELIMGIITRESAGINYRRSSANAQGLMQLIPGTAQDMANRLGIENYNINDPAFNIRAGSEYIKIQLQKYNGNLDYALAAYNWGPGNVDKWIRNGADVNRLPKETQKYIPEVRGYSNVYINKLREQEEVNITPTPEPPLQGDE